MFACRLNCILSRFDIRRFSVMADICTARDSDGEELYGLSEPTSLTNHAQDIVWLDKSDDSTETFSCNDDLTHAKVR